MSLFILNTFWALGGSVRGGFREAPVSQPLCAGGRGCGRRRQSTAKETGDISEAQADPGNLGSDVSGGVGWACQDFISLITISVPYHWHKKYHGFKGSVHKLIGS